MLEKRVSAPKRLFSDIILTYNLFRKRSSIIFFILLFSTYFLCPMDDFTNRKFIFTAIFNGSTSYSYLMSMGVLFVVSLVHFLYVINITIYFQDVTFRNFVALNKGKLLRGIAFAFLTFCMYFLLFKVFNDDTLKFSHLWLYVFLNYFKLFLSYLIIAFVTIILIDLKSLKEIFKEFTIKKFIFIVIKIIFAILIIDLILSPFLYCLENQLDFVNPFSNKLDIFSWIYYVLECLINTVLVMFLYNFIELLIHNKNREIVHKKAFKKISLISLSFLYLFIWFTCGIVYQSIARQSNGRDFIFQEDIKIKLQAKALKEFTTIKADDYTICDLIKNNELEKNIIHFKKNNNLMSFTSDNSGNGIDNSNSSNLNLVRSFDFNETEGTLCTSKIGKYWAEFYSSDFYHNEISSYKFEIQDSIKAPTDIGLKSDKLYPVTLLLYSSKIKNTNLDSPESNRIMILSNDKDMKNYNLVNKYTILLDDSSFVTRLKNEQGTSSNNTHNPMYSSLTDLLQHSIIFINYDFRLIKDNFNRIETQGVRFPLLDFLYYSAVTITTTGYGDILPNSTIIRTLVMFETFFGVAIPGFFISLLFFRVDHKENKEL